MTVEKPHKQIAVVLHSREKGGLESLALLLATHWHQTGHTVRLITIAEAKNPLVPEADIPEQCLAHPAPASSPLSRAFAMARTACSLRQALTSHPTDIIVAHGDRTNALTLLASIGLKARKIVAEHNHPHFHAIGRSWEMLRTWLYPQADRIIGVSAGVTAAFPPAWRSKGITVPNPVRPLNRPGDVFPIPGRIVAMGRLSHQKGFDILIDAFARIAGQYPTLHLVIHGEGEERERLEAQIAGYDLSTRISLPGYANQPAHAMAEGSIFVFPSRYEGFGLALAEAMSLGLPVIAADCPSGPGEMIRDGENGLLVPTENPEALAEALTRLIEDPTLAARLGVMAREICATFSDERWLCAWQKEICEEGALCTIKS